MKTTPGWKAARIPLSASLLALCGLWLTACGAPPSGSGDAATAGSSSGALASGSGLGGATGGSSGVGGSGSGSGTSSWKGVFEVR